MRIERIIFTAVLGALCGVPGSVAAELRPATLQAWNGYLDENDVRLEQRAARAGRFLWADESEERAARIRKGEVVVAPMLAHGTQDVPDGLIHHWIGAVFLPGATLDRLWAVIHDYDHYRNIYRPAVTASHALACSADTQDFQMTWQHKVLFVSAALQGRYHSRDVRLDAHRGYSVADATEVRQIEQYGHANQRMLEPGTGSGYLWRIRSVTRYEERDGGVMLEIEAIALTRDIPGSLNWLVAPVVNRLSLNSLSTTLKETRNATVDGHGIEVSASCAGRPGQVRPAKTTAAE